MSLIKKEYDEIRCFKFADCNKIIKCTLQDLENYDNYSVALVEMNFFGINQVYSFVDMSKIKKFANEIKNTTSIQYLLSLTRVIGDCPIENGINMKTRSISLKEIDYIEWLYLYQLNNLLGGMNLIADNDIDYDLQIGEYIDMPIIDLSKLNFSPYEDFNFKYIIKFKDNTFKFSNSILEFKEDLNAVGIFVYIQEFKCWQYMSKKKFEIFNYPKGIEIRYALTDSPRCFSKVVHSQTYNINSIDELLKYSIYIPTDIYFSKEFDTQRYGIVKKMYDAIEIIIDEETYTTSVLLTHDELGIESLQESSNHKILFMDKFCLLKLINNVICLKPY